MLLLFLIFVGPLLLYILIPSKGSLGELQVNVMHRIFLDEEIYFEINDVTIPTQTGTTQIDHIIVSRFGIFVVETKNMSGWIFGSANQKYWTQSLPNRKKFKFQNPIHQNYGHLKALVDYLGIDESCFHSVIMFIGDSQFKTPMPENVVDNGYISFITSKKEVLMDDNEVRKIVSHINAGMLPKTSETRKFHIESLKRKHGNRVHGCR